MSYVFINLDSHYYNVFWGEGVDYFWLQLYVCQQRVLAEEEFISRPSKWVFLSWLVKLSVSLLKKSNLWNFGLNGKILCLVILVLQFILNNLFFNSLCKYKYLSLIKIVSFTLMLQYNSLLIRNIFCAKRKVNTQGKLKPLGFKNSCTIKPFMPRQPGRWMINEWLESPDSDLRYVILM